MKKTKKISLTDKLELDGSISDARTIILEGIPQEILFTNSQEELCAYILNQFDFPEKINAADNNSLMKGCRIVLDLMAKNEIGAEENPNLKTDLDKLLYYLMSFESLPGHQKRILENQVNDDLKKANEMIDGYERYSFIKETPRNHFQRTIKDFYLRCLEEKTKIEYHLKNGINERAIVNASIHDFWSISDYIWNGYRDRPYRLPFPHSQRYFDHSSIDKVRHRIGPIPSRIGKELRTLYKEDKEKFYLELEKYIKIEDVLSNLISQINFLPFISDQRKKIFKELDELFKLKKFFGFYALAFTQIEGLFTDMCKLCKPNRKKFNLSLPNKVNLIRPFHDNSELIFDYYQYHLPNLRNFFLHIGENRNEGIKVLSKDILYDLEEVASVFSTMNLDAIKLLHLSRRRDDIDFMHINGICGYFELLASVKAKKQIHYFGNEIQELNKSYLPSVIFNVVFDLEEKIISLLDRIVTPIAMHSKMNGFEIDLNNTSAKEINDHSEDLKISISELINSQLRAEIEELLNVEQFFISYKKQLDINYLDIETINIIETLKKNYSSILKKIKLLAFVTGFKK